MAIEFEGELMPQTAEEAARRTLEQTVGTELSYLDLPIDPIAIAENLGLRVFATPLRTDVSGALSSRPGSRPAIFLNVSDAPNRQRFSCAHEIGHYVNRRDAGTAESFEYVDLRGPLASTGLDPDERFANQFAAALLMPASIVHELADIMDTSDLAGRFGVSTEAMGYRLVNLGLR